MKLAGSYEVDKMGLGGGGVPQVTPSMLSGVDDWYHVRISGIEEKKHRGGKFYLMVPFHDLNEQFVHRQAMFREDKLKRLCGVWGIAKLEDTDQLEGQELWIQLVSEPGWGPNASRTFVTCKDYALQLPEGAVEGKIVIDLPPVDAGGGSGGDELPAPTTQDNLPFF